MSKKINIKIVSVLIGLFVILIGLTLDTLIFNSIVISHYGGLSSVYSPYILSLATCMALGISIFSTSILFLIDVKFRLVKLIYIIALAVISCFIFITIAWRFQVGNYGNSITDVFDQHIYYIFIISFVIQVLFLRKLLSNRIRIQTKQKSIFLIFLCQIFVLLTFTLLNFGSIYEKIERRENEPSYMKGNSRIFRVVLNEKCGISPPIVDGKKIIEFPKNGLFILNEDKTYFHFSECKFYFTNEANEQQELYIVDIWDDGEETPDEYEKKHNVKGMIYGGVNHIPYSEEIGKYASSTPSAITFWDFFIHSRDFSYDQNYGAKMDVLTRTAVVKCRGGE